MSECNGHVNGGEGGDGENDDCGDIEDAIQFTWEAGMTDDGLVYLDLRLKNRLTYVEWDKQMMGPIRDTRWVEQGCCPCDMIYRLVNNDELDVV